MSIIDYASKLQRSKLLLAFFYMLLVLILFRGSWINPAYVLPLGTPAFAMQKAFLSVVAGLLIIPLLSPASNYRNLISLSSLNFIEANRFSARLFKLWLAIIFSSYYCALAVALHASFRKISAGMRLLGVFTSHHLLSDMNIVDTSVECIRRGLSVHIADKCNSFIPMNYVSAWGELFKGFGLGGEFSQAFLNKHPWYWIVLLAMIIIYGAFIYTQKSAFMALYLFLISMSPPIQILFFQHNNDLYIFVLIAFLVLLSRSLTRPQSFLVIGLGLALLSYMKLIAFPALLVFAAYRILSHQALRSNVTSSIAGVAICVIPIYAQLPQIAVLSKLATFPAFSSYGLVSLYSFANASVPISTKLINLIIVLAVIFKLVVPFAKTADYSALILAHQMKNDSNQSRAYVDLAVIGFSIYLATSTVMLSFSLRLWCLCMGIYALICLCTLNSSSTGLRSSMCLHPISKVAIVAYLCLFLYTNSYSEAFGAADKALGILFALFSAILLIRLLLRVRSLVAWIN